MSIEEVKSELDLAIESKSTIAKSNGLGSIENFRHYFSNAVMATKMISGLPLCLGAVSYVLGTYEEANEQLLRDASRRCTEATSDLIIAIPEVLVDSNGHEYFIGNVSKNNFDATYPFNVFLSNTETFPQEFIAGFLDKFPDGTINFRPNNNYITKKSADEQALFVDSILPVLTASGVMRVDNIADNIQFFSQDLYRNQLNKFLLERSLKRK